MILGNDGNRLNIQFYMSTSSLPYGQKALLKILARTQEQNSNLTEAKRKKKQITQNMCLTVTFYNLPTLVSRQPDLSCANSL